MSSIKSKDGFRQQALDLIGQATQRTRMIAYPTVLVELLGDHHAAALLMQMLYWGDRTTDSEGWFYKSYAEWRDELGLSEYQIRRCIDGDPRTQSERVTLRDLGVETQLKRAGKFGAPTRHYRVDQAVFVAALVEHLERQHGFNAGQGSQQCLECIPDNVEDRSLTLFSMDTEQCGLSPLNKEITDQENSSETTLTPMPALHPDEDENSQLFKPFEKYFGKSRTKEQSALKAEVQRLGATAVTEVLARCVGRGRSWQYVLRALANETAPLSAPQTAYPELYTLPDPMEVLADIKANAQSVVPENDLPISEQVNTAIGESTAAAIWNAAAHQLELQLERREFELWVKGAQLVDFEGETFTFVIAVRDRYARDYCQNRIYRTIRRAVEDAASRAGEGIALRFITREEWLQREIVAA